MAKKKQHKVGERFTKCGIIYEVREQVKGVCAGCALLIDNDELVRCTDAIRNDLEPCDEMLRDDEKNIIFVKVGEVPEGAPLNSDAHTPHEADPTIRDITANHFDEMLGEEPVSDDLEEAAKHYLYSNILYDDVYVGNPTDKDCIEMFKAGANWQKQQMMKQTISSQCFGLNLRGEALFSFPIKNDKYLVGSEVKIIIIKED